MLFASASAPPLHARGGQSRGQHQSRGGAPGMLPCMSGRATGPYPSPNFPFLVRLGGILHASTYQRGRVCGPSRTALGWRPRRAGSFFSPRVLCCFSCLRATRLGAASCRVPGLLKSRPNTPPNSPSGFRFVGLNGLVAGASARLLARFSARFSASCAARPMLATPRVRLRKSFRRTRLAEPRLRVFPCVTRDQAECRAVTTVSGAIFNLIPS